MAFLTVNHDEAQQGRYVAPEGFYECVISEARYDKTKGGTEYLRITLTIRDDVEQEGMGERIDWPIWRKKAPTPRDPDGFPVGTIQQLSRVMQFAQGKEFASIDEWMAALAHKPLRVEIKHEEYNGRTNARVAYIFDTEHPNVSIKNQGFVEVEDEELPF